MLLTSVQPKLRSSRFASSGARRPSPRAVVERLLRNAFQYRWNGKLESAWALVFRQSSTSTPVIRCASGSSRASIV